MQKNAINPWQWQDNFGYSQAVEVKEVTGTLYCAGQCAMDEQGKPVAGTMAEQMKLTLANVAAVINQAGYSTSDIVRLNVYTTSVAETFEAYGEFAGWLHANGCKPASTLLEIKALAFPELKVEIEATAVK